MKRLFGTLAFLALISVCPVAICAIASQSEKDLSVVLTLQLNGTPLVLDSMGPQTEFSFGILTEFTTTEQPAKLNRGDAEFNLILLVDRKIFYVSTKQEFKIKDKQGLEVDTSGIKFDADSDEERLLSLLQTVVPGFPVDKEKKLDMTIVHFVTTGKCDSCATNRGCAFKGCTAYCCWSGGFVCKRC
jgi:hypothetical protein